MVNGDLSHSTWLAPQLDELSLLQELCSVSSMSHNASAHISATATQSRQSGWKCHQMLSVTDDTELFTVCELLVSSSALGLKDGYICVQDW